MSNSADMLLNEYVVGIWTRCQRLRRVSGLRPKAEASLTRLPGQGGYRLDSTTPFYYLEEVNVFQTFSSFYTTSIRSINLRSFVATIEGSNHRHRQV